MTKYLPKSDLALLAESSLLVKEARKWRSLYVARQLSLYKLHNLPNCGLCEKMQIIVYDNILSTSYMYIAAAY